MCYKVCNSGDLPLIIGIRSRMSILFVLQHKLLNIVAIVVAECNI